MAAPRELTSETETLLDSWFAALDGQATDGPPAQVLAIHDDGREWWVQVARGDDFTNTVVLRLSRCASVLHACAALKRWHSPAATYPRVIPAMCVV